jgi:hypothetical protein
MSLAVYGGFAAILGAEAGRSARALLIGGTAGLVGGIALSRAMLHVHTVPEVIVGLAVGLLTLSAIVAIVAQWPPRHSRLGWVAAIALGIALLAHGQRWPAEHVVHRVAGWLSLLQPWCG